MSENQQPPRLLINSANAEDAVNHMWQTDQELARRKAYLQGLNNQLKTIKAIEFLKASGSVGVREATAYASDAYQAHLRKVEDATLDYETMNNQRETYKTFIDMWRSHNANQRYGSM